jgi:hypothetical protein
MAALFFTLPGDGTARLHGHRNGCAKPAEILAEKDESGMPALRREPQDRGVRDLSRAGPVRSGSSGRGALVVITLGPIDAGHSNADVARMAEHCP